MAGLNKVMIIGHLGRDPEISQTQSGVAVVKLSIATTEVWYDKQSGEKRERTEWHRVVFFSKQAETIGRYTSKGSQLYVEGKLQTSQYEKDGITRYTTDIMGSNFQFLGGNNQQQNNAGFQQGQGNFQPPQNQGFSQPPQGGFQQGAQQQGNGFSQPPTDDDIPF